MSSNQADLIRLLEAELDFIEGGGYEPRAGQPNEERPMFYRSLACINHWLVPGAKDECSDNCALMQFVPESHKDEGLPCHFIPLDAQGATVRSLEGNQARLEEAVKGWLRAKIQELKAQGEAPPGQPAVQY